MYNTLPLHLAPHHIITTTFYIASFHIKHHLWHYSKPHHIPRHTIIHQGSTCLKGSARPYWRIILVSKITIDVDKATKSFEPQFWWCHQHHGDHITWLIIAIWGQRQDVYGLKKVQIDSYMCTTCRAFIPFCSMHPEILTIRAPLNGDLLCGHVYVRDLITVITVADDR